MYYLTYLCTFYLHAGIVIIYPKKIEFLRAGGRELGDVTLGT